MTTGMGRRCLAQILIAASFTSGLGAAVFNDGGEHTIDAGNSFPADTVEVFDGMGAIPTTVNVADGGEIGDDLTANEHSVININGGEIRNTVNAHGQTVLNIAGGTIHDGSEGFVNVYDQSVLTMTGGRIGNPNIDLFGEVNAYGHARVDIISGEIGWYINAYDNSIIQILDVRTNDSVFSYGAGQLHLSGGIVNSMESHDDSVMTFSGGELRDGVFTLDRSRMIISGGINHWGIQSTASSVVTITGGDITGNNSLSDSDLLIQDASQLILVGDQFNYPLGDVPDLTGTLTGVLLDGNPFELDFERDSTARITLAIPEPATASLLTIVAMIGIRQCRTT